MEGESSGSNEDEGKAIGKSFEDECNGKEVEVQSFDRKYPRTKIDLIPYEQIKTYQHCIRPIDEKYKKKFLVDYRQRGNYVRGEKPTVQVTQTTEIWRILGVIGDRILVRERVRAIIIDGKDPLYVIGELWKDTTEKYN